MTKADLSILPDQPWQAVSSDQFRTEPETSDNDDDSKASKNGDPDPDIPF